MNTERREDLALLVFDIIVRDHLNQANRPSKSSLMSRRACMNSSSVLRLKVRGRANGTSKALMILPGRGALTLKRRCGGIGMARKRNTGRALQRHPA